jgi:outer membrane usher protein FimD/PapC
MREALGRAAREWRRGLARVALPVLVAGLGAASTPVVAAPSTQVALLGAAGPETIVAEVTLNQQKKGSFFLTVIDGQFLVRAQDLKAIGVDGARGLSWRSGDDEYVWVGSIPGLAVTFDEARLSLDLTAAPAILPATTVDLWAGRGEQVFYPDNASAFFNYELGYAGGNLGVPDGVIATTQFGGRVGNFLLLSDSTCSALSGSTRCVRLSTSLIHDRRDTLVRTTVGDVGFATGWLGSSYRMGGVSYSKLYDIDPYVIRYPQQSLTGQLQTPSEVDVYIDGQRVRTLRLPAGDYDLRNVTQTTGARSVDLVVRDAFGREQRVSTSFYASDRSLKAGLHEYSYNVGALRQNFGLESNDYGDLAFAGFHRYGVSDRLTVGVRGEARQGRVSGGPSAAIVLGSAGLLSLAASLSDDEGRTGAAALAAYTFQGRHFNAGLVVRKDSPHYTTLLDSVERRNWDAAGTLGYTTPALGSLAVGAFTSKAYNGEDRRGASLSYGRTLFGSRGSVFVTVVKDWSPDQRIDVFAGFAYNFDADYALTGYYQRLRGGTSESLQFQKAQPVGEGLGYVLGVSRASLGSESQTQLTPSFQYNGRWASVRGYAQQADGPGSPRDYALSVAGGVAWASGMLAVGRPITDSFGVVKVDELEGVRVLVNNEEIGRTGPDGRVFVPSLSSFIDNQIAIDVRSVPLEFTFPESMRVVSPAYRAGAVVNFDARRLRAYVGTLTIRSAGSTRPAEFIDVTLDSNGRRVSFVTGRGGEYYIEDLEPGGYRGRAASNGLRCSFELEVPAARAALTDLGVTVCDDAAAAGPPPALAQASGETPPSPEAAAADSR